MSKNVARMAESRSKNAVEAEGNPLEQLAQKGYPNQNVVSGIENMVQDATNSNGFNT